MSVIIKGMEMPKRCFECFAFNAENTYCALYSHCIPARHSLKPHEKPEWCELIEVPTPHGRLIDADALYNHMRKVHDEWREHPELHESIVPVVDDETIVLYFPTIIESEGE